MTRSRPQTGKRGSTGRARSTPAQRSGFFASIGRGIAAMWRALAVVVGGVARAVGRNAATARDLDPEHRR
ncbi:MAG TPA: hypothetical protein VE074_10220, partial [Jatrophihabitantaceae bacterium]|nr:hypothetical protein [Jatrophihabitantaceae bacterium]